MLVAANIFVVLTVFGGLPPELAPIAPPAPVSLVVRDGHRLIIVERSSLDPTRVHLRWSDGRSAFAGVDAHAIVHVADPTRLAEYDLRLVEPLMARAGLYRVRSLRDEDGLALASRLAGSTIDVFPDFAFPRARSSIDVPPDDPRHGGQWYLETIGIHAAWAIETGNAGVVIAVVDGGCDLAHPDLAKHVEPGLDLVDDDDDASYPPEVAGNEHGTACAGLVAAVGDNGIGIAGTCPECHLRCVRLLPGAGGPVPIGNDIEAYDQQLAWNVAVSSNSWGFEDHFPVPNLLARAISTLIEEGRDGLGAIVVFAVGNDAREVKDDELYAIDGVVTVGAINAFDELASFSNSGAALDIVAPAGTLTTDIAGADGADEGDYTSLFGGTSSACPVAAGVAALLVAAAPDRSGAEIVDALIHTSRPAPFAVPDEQGHDLQYGYGIVDPAAALARLVPVVVEPEPEVTEPTPEPSPELDVEPIAEPSPEVTTPRDDDGCANGAAAWWALLGALPFLRSLCRGRACSALRSE